MAFPSSSAIVLVLALLAVPQVTLAQTCKIGIVAPLTGPLIFFGSGMVNGAKLAVAESGGAISLSLYDSQCNPDLSTTAMRKAAADKVNGVVGDLCSGASLAASKVAASSQIPMISPLSTSPLLTTAGGPYFNRVVLSDTYQGALLANLAMKKGSKVGIIFGTEPYGTGIFAESARVLFTTGGTLVGAVGMGAKWTTGSLGHILAAKPDAIILESNYVPEVFNAAVELRKLGYKGPLYGSDTTGGDDSVLKGPYGAALAGMTSTVVYLGSADFQAKYKKAYNVASVPPGAAGAYDAIKAFQAACVKNGKTQTGAAIQAILRSSAFSITGATGLVKFDANGDRVFKDLATAYSLLVAKGTWTVVA